MKRNEAKTLEPDSVDEWLVEPGDEGFAVRSTTRRWAAVFTDRARACLAAAILPQTARGTSYRLNRREDSQSAGFDVTLETSRPIGRLREYSPETIEALHVTERIVRSPEALAWLLEAASPEALETAWRIVGLRRDASPPP